MGHKYLKELGIVDDMNIPNTDYKDTEGRNKRFKKQRKKFGFDERETWEMDFTLACWVYEHFKWYVEYAPIDTTFYMFDIEVVDNVEKNTIKVEKATQEQAIEKVLEYIEKYFINSYEDENAAYFYYKCAFRIVAEIMPVMWW